MLKTHTHTHKHTHKQTHKHTQSEMDVGNTIECDMKSYQVKTTIVKF